MKDMEDEGKIAKYFIKYADDRIKLKTMVRHELEERSREEQLTIRTKTRALIDKHSDKKTLSDDAYIVFSAELLDNDREYCDKIRKPPSDPDFMTYEDLVEEEKKLKGMIDVIVEEKKNRKLEPKIKVFKNVVNFIERMNKITVTYREEDDSRYGITPPVPGRRVGSTRSSSSVVRTVLTNEPSDPTGMPIVATSATAVRVAEVATDEAMGAEEEN
jgi:hypothetical protein